MREILHQMANSAVNWLWSTWHIVLKPELVYDEIMLNWISLSVFALNHAYGSRAEERLTTRRYVLLFYRQLDELRANIQTTCHEGPQT